MRSHSRFNCVLQYEVLTKKFFIDRDLKNLDPDTYPCILLGKMKRDFCHV